LLGQFRLSAGYDRQDNREKSDEDRCNCVTAPL
jgi:hypothetical protein